MRKLFAVPLTAMTLILAGVVPSYAWKAQEGTLRGVKDATQDVRGAVNNVRGSIDDGFNRLILALMGQQAEASAYVDKGIEGQKRMMDAAEVNASNRLRQEFRAKAESGDFDPDPAICLIAGLFGSDPDASADVSLGSTVASRAASKASGGDPAVIAGGVTLARSLNEDRAKFTSILGISDPTANPAVLVANPTIATSSDPNVAAALERLVRNMTDPVPPVPVTAEAMRTGQGQERGAKRVIQATRAATSAEALAMIINMRSEVGAVNDEWKAYVEDIANYNRPVGEKMSELQGIDIRTLRYYAPSETALTMRNNMSQKGLLQVLVDQMSLANRMAYLQLELDSRRAMVETQILSTLAN